MLRQTAPQWGWHPALPQPAQARQRTRWLWTVPLLAGSLAAFGWVASHDPGPGLHLSNRGWLTIAAAVVVAGLLAAHRAGGQLLRAIVEYGVVALLVALLATATPDRAARARAHNPRACPPVVQTRAWIGCLWQQANTTTETNHHP
jgi:hypothetical protein